MMPGDEGLALFLTNWLLSHINVDLAFLVPTVLSHINLDNRGYEFLVPAAC